MATIIKYPNDRFINGQVPVGKFCLTDDEAKQSMEQFKKDTLQAIIIVSNKEQELRELQETHDRMAICIGTVYKNQPKKNWFDKLKDTVSDTHKSALSWYKEWKYGKIPDKTFEEQVEEVRINIVDTRRIEAEDSGYEC